MSAPQVSVIVPVYNVAPYLDRCVRSLLAQTLRDFELILIDDGSTDGSSARCDDWAVADSRVRAVHQENRGLSAARNAGMRAALGEYFSFVDSDDWVEPCFLEQLVHAIKATGADIAACGYRKVADDAPFPPQPAPAAPRIYEGEEILAAYIHGRGIEQITVNKIYPRKLVEDLPFEVGKFHEDEYWTYQVLGRAQQYAAIDYAGYNYFMRDGSIMRAPYSLKRLDAVEAKRRRVDYLMRTHPAIGEEDKVNFLFSCFFHGQMSLRYLSGEDRAVAMPYLTKMARTYKITSDDLRGETFSHKVWVFLARISFPLTCRLRNLLRIGF